MSVGLSWWRPFPFAMVLLGSQLLAGFDEMGKKIPANANAVIAVNVAQVLKSPLAEQNEWKKKWEDAFAYGAMTVPADTLRLLGAARMKRDMESSDWQVSLMETNGNVSLSDIAQAEGGYTDKLWDKMAVVSPGGAYFVEFGPTFLAGYEPSSDRANVVKWVRESASSQGPTSQFLRGIIRTMGSGSDVIIALDMEDAYSASDIRRNMEADPFLFSEGKKPDLDALAQCLASIKTVAFKASITDKIQAKTLIEFGIDPALMEFYAKPVLKQILNRSGMEMPDVDSWTAKVSDKTLVFEGQMSAPGLRSALSMFSLPSPNHMDSAQGKFSNDPAVMAEASRKYFRSINDMLQQYSGRRDYSEVSRWLQQNAQRISRLPILNVDPKLVSWGNDVASRLRQVATLFRQDQQELRGKMAGVSSNNTYYYDFNGNYSGSGYYNQSAGQAYQNLQDTARQQSQQMAQSRADSIGKAQQIMSGLLSERDQVRDQMTQKYKIQF